MRKFNKNTVTKTQPPPGPTPFILQTEKMKESLGNLAEKPPMFPIEPIIIKKPQQWEYLCKWIEKIDEKILDSHGADGWELINFIGTHGGFNFIFKRPL